MRVPNHHLPRHPQQKNDQTRTGVMIILRPCLQLMSSPRTQTAHSGRANAQEKKFAKAEREDGRTCPFVCQLMSWSSGSTYKPRGVLSYMSAFNRWAGRGDGREDKDAEADDEESEDEEDKEEEEDEEEEEEEEAEAEEGDNESENKDEDKDEEEEDEEEEDDEADKETDKDGAGVEVDDDEARARAATSHAHSLIRSSPVTA